MNCHILKFFTIKWNSLLVGQFFFFFFRFTYFSSAYSKLIFSFFYLHFIGEDQLIFFSMLFFLDIFLALIKMILVVKTALSILFAKLSCLKRSYNFKSCLRIFFFFGWYFLFLFWEEKGSVFVVLIVIILILFFGSVFF